MKNRVFTLLIFVFVISLLLVGCKTNNKGNGQRKYGFQPPINDLYWGTPLNEIEKILDIKNGVDGVTYDYEAPITTITLKNQIKKFGHKATVSLEIYDAPKEKWYPYKSSYLAYVRLTYKNINGKQIRDSISKFYNSKGNNWVDLRKSNCTTWLSKDKTKDISPKIKKKLDNYWSLLNEHTNNSSLMLSKVSKDSINNIVLVYSDKGGVVTFTGDTAVQINQVTTRN